METNSKETNHVFVLAFAPDDRGLPAPHCALDDDGDIDDSDTGSRGGSDRSSFCDPAAIARRSLSQRIPTEFEN